MADNVAISWTIVGADLFAARLDLLAYKGMNASPALQEVGETWVQWIEEQFETQGARFLGHKWARLAPATISRRKATGPILIDKANLLLEATDVGNVKSNDSEVVIEIADDQAEYGGYHQTGTTRMPARPILELGPIDIDRSVNIVEEFLFS